MNTEQTEPDSDPKAEASALPAEGLYVAQGPIQTSAERVIQAGQLVQLGYNGNADPILFFPSRAASANALLFPDKGTKIERSELSRLFRVQVAGPRPQTSEVN